MQVADNFITYNVPVSSIACHVQESTVEINPTYH